MNIRKSINNVLRRYGYSVEHYDEVGGLSFGLYQYRDDAGGFDYERYKEVQTAGNVRKIENVFVKEENIKFFADYISSVLGTPRFGLCHGTRRGLEQTWFRKYLDCDVIGTEISHTATEFPHTIQWDFHQVKGEWIDKFDFIYSNSFDHSFDPRACLRAWMSCVRPGGLCIIEHTSMHEFRRRKDPLDPFGAPLEMMPYLICDWADGQFGVRRILQTPTKGRYDRSHGIVIQRFERPDVSAQPLVADTASRAT